MENYTNGSAEVEAAMSPRLNCTRSAMSQFPVDVLFTSTQRRHGAILLHVVVAAYMIYGLVVVCELYFVPSIKCICHTLKLRPDVAGATFMAVGTSAPELFTAIIGTTIAKDNTGFGTMIGSAAFNLTFAIGIIAVIIGKETHIDWRPFVRDSVCYVLSVVAVTLVVRNGSVTLVEAISLLLLYGMYILAVCLPSVLSTGIPKLWSRCREEKLAEDKNSEIIPMSALTLGKQYDTIKQSDGISRIPETDLTEKMKEVETADKSADTRTETNDDELVFPESESPLTPPSSLWKRALWVIGLPLGLLLFITIPDCRQPRWRRWFGLTFLMATIWLAVTAYIMVWTVVIVGNTLYIPDEVMALIFLGPVTSIPDVMGSFIVAREDYWDMALSTCISSNVFELLFCLGISYLIASLMSHGGAIHIVFANGLIYISCMLVVTIVVTGIFVVANRWRIDRRIGVLLIVSYVIYIVLAVLYESGVLCTLRIWCLSPFEYSS
ncbi:sodium/potassium/calcium exchanger 5-like [Ptychodera flava]|uniref:sodium/potassium/calcium exchanger 5-like n=1 Tax=Ptychodera flava TaxID=63121 RepID=UPI00396A3C99